MSFFSWFRSPMPLPTIHIRNLDGEVIFTANWSSLEGRSLAGLTLHNADLKNTNLRGCDCQGTDFTGSKMQKANLRGCNLKNANVTYCDLSGADLRGAKVSGADFSASEFGRRSCRCNMEGVTGIQQSAISSYELVGSKFNDGKKDFKFKKSKPLSPLQRLQLPERPRALLVLGEVGFQWNKYEGSSHSKQREFRRRSHFQKKRHSEGLNGTRQPTPPREIGWTHALPRRRRFASSGIIAWGASTLPGK